MALVKRVNATYGPTNALKWSWEVSPWMLCAVLQENARAAGAVLRYACSNAFNSS